MQSLLAGVDKHGSVGQAYELHSMTCNVLRYALASYDVYEKIEL